MINIKYKTFKFRSKFKYKNISKINIIVLFSERKKKLIKCIIKNKIYNSN